LAYELAVLVTGSPRSGTTWVGRVVAQAPGMYYLHEPFNIGARPCSCGTNFVHCFQYISAENEFLWRDHLKHLMQSSPNRFNVHNALLRSFESRRIGPMRDLIKGIQATSIIVKDPLAVFSAEWLASTFDMQVVVVLRHPAAVASSYKRLQWAHNFEHFLNQPLLMSDHLHPFKAEIEEFARSKHQIVEQAALLWKLIHHLILHYQRIHPDWIYVRHEDLSYNPHDEYQLLFQRLSLGMPDTAKHFIENYSKPGYPAESDDPYSIKLDSSKTSTAWRSRLSQTEIKSVYSRVGDIGRVFYPQQYW
jgi:hypothetical protein